MIDETEEQQADRRRSALRGVFEQYGLSPATAAREAGCNPNTFYNFFNGRSHTLSIDVLEQLRTVMPGVTVEDMIGLSAVKPARKPRVLLRFEAKAGAWRIHPELPPEEQAEVTVPIDVEATMAGAYAVRMGGAEMNVIYPQGSTLVVLPMAQWDRPLEARKRLLVRRTKAGKHELSIRELEVSNGTACLRARSHDAKLYRKGIEMPWPAHVDVWQDGGCDVSLLGVVIMAIVPE